MGQFKDREEFVKIFTDLFEIVRRDAEMGPKLAGADMIVRFEYPDMDAAVNINLKEPSKEEGAFFDYAFGEAIWPPDVTMSQSSDFSNRFWQGKENAVMAIATRKIQASGNVPKAMKLLPLIRPVFRLFPKMLREQGRDDLVV